MSAFCGIYYPESTADVQQDIGKMVTALSFWNPDKTEIYTAGNLALAHMMLYTTPESEEEVIPYSTDSYTLVADARIDNRRELNDALGLSIMHPDIIYVAKSYEKWNTGCCPHLYGDYSAALYNRHEHSLFCFRDPVGCVPFFYYYDNEKFVFSTSIKGILALPKVDVTPDGQWMADSLFGLRSELHRTCYKNIRRLPPGHSLFLDRKKLTVIKYFDWYKTKELRLADEKEYQTQFTDKINQAVTNRMRSKRAVSAELSGGLDSSAICCLAARADKGIAAFTHILPDDTYHPYTDERQFAETVCQYAGINNHLLVGSEDKNLLTAFQQWLWISGEPSQLKYHALSTGLYEEVQKQGSNILLSGFGGDELVSSAAGDYLLQLARERLWPLLWNELKGNNDHGTAARKFLKIYFRQFLPAKNRVKHALKTTTANAATIRRYNLKQRYNSTFKPQGGHSFTQRFCEILSGPVISRRLETCALAALPYRIVYRYPLLDRALLEFFIALPPSIKYSERMGRKFLRQAMAGIIPDEIRLRTDKYGLAIPSVYYRFFNEIEEIELYILGSGSNAANKFIDRNKLIQRFEALKTNQKDQNVLGFFNTLEILLFFELQNP